MLRSTGYLVVLCLLLLVSAATAADSEKETAAVSAAEKWLAVVDDGKYVESGQEAATYFRNAVPQTQSEQSLQAVRKPLGKCLSRTVAARTFRTTLSGAPDGEYVII